jgi:hypothetical protein
MVEIKLPYGEGESFTTIKLPENEKDAAGGVISEAVIAQLANLPEKDKEVPAYVLKAVVAYRNAKAKAEAPVEEEVVLTPETLEADALEAPAEEVEEEHKKGKGHKGKH